MKNLRHNISDNENTGDGSRNVDDASQDVGENDVLATSDTTIMSGTTLATTTTPVTTSETMTLVTLLHWLLHLRRLLKCAV